MSKGLSQRTMYNTTATSSMLVDLVSDSSDSDAISEETLPVQAMAGAINGFGASLRSAALLPASVSSNSTDTQAVSEETEFILSLISSKEGLANAVALSEERRDRGTQDECPVPFCSTSATRRSRLVSHLKEFHSFPEIFARALAGTPTCASHELYAQTPARLLKQHATRGLDSEKCGCGGKFSIIRENPSRKKKKEAKERKRPEKSNGMSSLSDGALSSAGGKRSVKPLGHGPGESKSNHSQDKISCYIADCGSSFDTHAHAYEHGIAAHNFKPVEVMTLKTGPDLGENIDELLMSLSYNGIQLSCGSWKTLRPRKKKLRDGASQDGHGDDADTKHEAQLSPQGRRKSGHVESSDSEEVVLDASSEDSDGKTDEARKPVQRIDNHSPTKKAAAQAEKEAPGSLAGESKHEAPRHTISKSYKEPKASSTPSAENTFTRRAKALLGIGGEEDSDSFEKDIYFFCHRSGNPGAKGPKQKDAINRPRLSRRKTNRGPRRQWVGPRFDTKTVKKLGFLCPCRLVVKVRPIETALYYYPQHNHHRDDIDEYCRRVPKLLRQVILDYYIMGMRPREILKHVADLSWADLRERDNLIRRFGSRHPLAKNLHSAEQGASPTPADPPGSNSEPRTEVLGGAQGEPVGDMLGNLSMKDFTFEELLTTPIICGICRSKSATPLEDLRYLSAKTLEDELMLAIQDPLRGDSVLLQYLGRRGEKPKLRNPIPRTYIGSKAYKEGPLKEGTLCLIFQTPFQARMMARHGTRALLCDATHGTTQLGYRLLSVFISINLGATSVGMAVGWAVTAQETEGAWGVFFDCLKQNVDRVRKADGESLDGAETFTTYALVSDDDSSSWKAAKNVFHAQRRYLCLWHVLQNFLRKSSMMRKKSTRKKVWRHLYHLLHAQRTDDLDGLIAQFCEHWKGECPRFVKYFSNHYASRKEQWMLAYRDSKDLSTNNIVESFHRVIKHLFIEKKKNLRIGRMIDRLFDYEASACRRILLLELEARRKSSILRSARHTPQQFKLADVGDNEGAEDELGDDNGSTTSSTDSDTSSASSKPGQDGHSGPDSDLEPLSEVDSEGPPKRSKDAIGDEAMTLASLRDTGSSKPTNMTQRGTQRIVRRMEALVECVKQLPSHCAPLIQTHLASMETAIDALVRHTVHKAPSVRGNDSQTRAEYTDLSRVIEPDASSMQADGAEFVLRRLVSNTERQKRAEEMALNEEAEEYVLNLIGKRQKV